MGFEDLAGGTIYALLMRVIAELGGSWRQITFDARARGRVTRWSEIHTGILRKDSPAVARTIRELATSIRVARP